jgi:hypothetical protein
VAGAGPDQEQQVAGAAAATTDGRVQQPTREEGGSPPRRLARHPGLPKQGDGLVDSNACGSTGASHPAMTWSAITTTTHTHTHTHTARAPRCRR